MSNLENEPSLGDSSGSDGSLAKDLSHQAEMNFASQGILPFENENDLERSRMVEMEKGQTENVIEEEDTLENCDLAKEAEIAPKYIENAMMPDLMEEDCNSNEALMLCEYCHGPITKMKKFGKSGQQFCSKQCAESQTRNEDLIDDDGNDDDEAQIDTSTNEMTDVQDSDQVESSVSQKSNAEVEKSVEDSEAANLPPGFDWNEYRKMLKEKAAPKNCFGRLPKEVKGLIPGMKLEALDKNNPCNYCVATVIDVVGRRVRIRYDGFGNDDSQDFWCNFQADELYPIGWCAENSFPLQPPAGITSTLEDWKIFLTKTLTGALATPMDLFRENEFRLQTKVHSFQAGMRVECIHPKKPSIICPARVTKSLGPYVYQITTEPLPHLPAHMFYGNSESNGIFSFGWTMKNGIDLALPAYLDGSGLTKDQYVAACRARSAPAVGLHKRFKNGFKLGQKLEAVDLEEPSVIRVATVFNVIGRILHLLFDGRRKFQYVDCENEDIFPIGWCMKTGHPLSTPYGMVYPTVEDQSVETEQVTDDNGNRAMVLPSFHTVLGKNVPGAKEELQKMLKAKVDGVIQPTAAEKLPQDSKDATEKKTEDTEKQEESHCVYFNKSCLIGPYLDPDKVATMPDQTAFAKPPAAVRFALEHVINVAIDPIETMDAIQDGFCPKLFSKGKRKILKKGLFRFDTKLRAGRFLKRLCKKLKSCEYFLSFDPAKDPCPLQCQISGTTSLESFVTMRGMIAKSEPKKDPLDELRRKRGRPRKDDFEPQKHDNNQPQRDYNHSPDGWTANVKTTVATPVRVLNPTSYHGRPLVPIAPSSKIAQSPVSIMPAGSQIQRVRPPPPYEINGRASFVQPVPITTVVTTATQARMVAPVNLRMISPSGPATVVSGQDPSTPTFAAQSLATVLVVTKPHTTGQPVSGLLSFRGNVPNHGLQLPLSPSSRKPQVASNIARMKSPGTIKIHGPMIDQLPGVMNPMSQKHKVVYSPSTKLDSPVKHQHKIKPAIHVPGGQNEKEFNRYRDSHHYEQGTTNQVHQFVEIKNKADIKIEPQEQYQITRTSPNNHNHSHVVPTIHIHHPASSSFHSVPTDDLQMRPNSVEILTHIPDRAINDNSGRAVSTLTSPARSDFPSMRFEVAPHQNVNRHGQSVRTHATGQGHNPGQNQTTQSQLHVSTTAADESQSAISPLHSPPPLRPAPANQHRSIALRSPPNLTPSTVLSHFDFSPVSTNTIISQPGLVYHQQQNSQAIVNNGHAGTTDLTIVSVTNNITPATNTTTVTLAYIPVKTQANDKIVYVPYNQNMKNDAVKQHHHQQQQQQSVIYAKQRKPSHHYPGPHSNTTVISQTPRDESPIGPYSGITRKFTVRTLQRDPSSLPSSLTTVRIQGPSVTEIGPVKPRENQTGSYPNSNNSKNRYEIQENMAFPGNQVNKVDKAATSPENLTRRENLPHSRSAGNENNLNNNEEDDLSQHFQDFEEISDYDENVDYDEFYDDNVANFEEGEQAEDRKSIGYFRGGRKRGKRRFFVRRKGSTNHQYKIKYKQALEQAKFMREQRPSFMTTNLQNEIPEDCRRIATNNDMSNQRSSAQRNDELDNRTNSSTNSIKSHDASFHLERINTEGMSNNDATPKNSVVIQSKPEIAFKENRNDNSNLFDSKRDSLLMMDGTSETKNVNSDKRFSPMETTDKQNEFATKKRIEGKGPKRKRKNNSSFENDFFYGQWMVSQDSLQKRKKRNSANSLLSPTQYLSDPFDRVKLPQNPESWTQSDVSSFISATECSQYADTLKEQEIDGSALLLLTRESLMEFTGMKLGPALKLCGYVAHLKGRIRMRQNIAVMQN